MPGGLLRANAWNQALIRILRISPVATGISQRME